MSYSYELLINQRQGHLICATLTVNAIIKGKNSNSDVFIHDWYNYTLLIHPYFIFSNYIGGMYDL